MVRIKHRYLLINFLYPGQEPPNVKSPAAEEPPWTVQFRRPSSDRLDAKLLLRMIRDGIAEVFGDYGSGVASGTLQVKYISSATSTAIVRVARAHYRMVWAALSFVTRIPTPVDQLCVIQVVRVSGTIKKSEEEAIRRARLTIVRARRAGKKSSSLIPGAPIAAATTQHDDDDLDMFTGIEDPDEPGDLDEDEDG